MFKNLLGMFKKTSTKFFNPLLNNSLYPAQKFYFARSTKKDSLSLNKQYLASQKVVDYTDENGQNVPHIRKFAGTFPYLPLDDHPLIPGYARLISITKEIAEKLVADNVEEKKLCMSVLKNPDRQQGISLLYINN
jgi:hypothetical protein